MRRWNLALLAATSIGIAPARALAQPNVPRWTLIEDLRLDANVEDFSAINRVVVAADGRMAVPLPQDMQVRIYNPAGHRIAAVGRRGSGPGEFRHLGAMTWISDTLFVDDQRLRRFTYIGPDGRLLRTKNAPPPMAPTSFTGSASDSMFLFFIARSASPGGAVLGIAAVARGEAARLRPLPRVVVSLSPNGTARVIATPPQFNDPRWMVTISGLSNPIPFAQQPLIVFAADGSRFAFLTADQSSTNGTYAVNVLTANGDALFARSYPFRGVPISGPAMDSALASMLPKPGQQEDGSNPRRFQAAARQRMPVVHAPVEHVVLAIDSTVWVTLRGTADGSDAVVLDSQGSPLAVVRLPPRSRIQQATSSSLWVTELDEFDLVSVVRYRLIRPE